jgi:hypothetical protein
MPKINRRAALAAIDSARSLQPETDVSPGQTLLLLRRLLADAETAFLENPHPSALSAISP